MVVKIRKEVMKVWLMKANLSQTEFAERSGVPEVTLSGIMTGRLEASQKNRRKIIATTGLNFDTLFEIKGETQEASENQL